MQVMMPERFHESLKRTRWAASRLTQQHAAEEPAAGERERPGPWGRPLGQRRRTPAELDGQLERHPDDHERKYSSTTVQMPLSSGRSGAEEDQDHDSANSTTVSCSDASGFSTRHRIR